MTLLIAEYTRNDQSLLEVIQRSPENSPAIGLCISHNHTSVTTKRI